MKKPACSVLVSLVVLMLPFVSNAGQAEVCVHDAKYVRQKDSLKDPRPMGTYLTVGAAVESSDGTAMRAPFELRALGNIAPDGAPTVGNLEGELTLTDSGCAGYFSLPEMSCALIVTFTGKKAKV